MKLFEEGAEVSAFCYKKLKDAEQKIKEFEKTEDSADDSE